MRIPIEYQYQQNEDPELPTCTLGYAKETDPLARGKGRGISIDNFLCNRIG